MLGFRKGFLKSLRHFFIAVKIVIHNILPCFFRRDKITFGNFRHRIVFDFLLKLIDLLIRKVSVNKSSYRNAGFHVLNHVLKVDHNGIENTEHENTGCHRRNGGNGKHLITHNILTALF